MFLNAQNLCIEWVFSCAPQKYGDIIQTHCGGDIEAALLRCIPYISKLKRGQQNT